MGNLSRKQCPWRAVVVALFVQQGSSSSAPWGLSPGDRDPYEVFACLPPQDTFTFCNTSLPVEARVWDLVGRIDDSIKPNLLTARGHGGDGAHLQSIPELGVPGYYWGTNCLHSLNQAGCANNSRGELVCPTNFPSGPSFGATFDRELIQSMAGVIGTELRALFRVGSARGLDCWGGVVNLNRDPRWGRNGEGGLEDAFAMSELATAWARGFQAPRPVLKANVVRPGVAPKTSESESGRELLQGILTLKHMAVNSLENTFPFTRHSFDANETYGVDNYVLADYYLRPFVAAVSDGDLRGVMCSYNAVEGIPTCLSPLIRNTREENGFRGYVTSDSDSVSDAVHGHHYVATLDNASSLALVNGHCDIDSGDSYYNNLLSAVANDTLAINMSHVDRALFNTFRQRFDLGLFDPPTAFDWPTTDAVGTDSSWNMSLRASLESLVLLRNDNGILPITAGANTIAVVGPHALAKKVLVQPYPFVPACRGGSSDFSCLESPFEAIAKLNGGTRGRAGSNSTVVELGCDLYFPDETNISKAVSAANMSDIVVLMLGIETCGMNPSHNVNPASPGRCYQEKSTTGYVFPDAFMELEAHDRTTIALPDIQKKLASTVLGLGKPTVIVLLNAGAVAIDGLLAQHAGSHTLALGFSALAFL